MEQSSNWVLFSYNGNDTVVRRIMGATFTQLSEFIDSGGNQDDPEEWLFESWNDVQFVQIPNDTMGLGNSTNLVYVGDSCTTRICDLPAWIVSIAEYPEGKIVRVLPGHGDLDADAQSYHADQAALGILDMEQEAEQEDPEPPITGKNAF